MATKYVVTGVINAKHFPLKGKGKHELIAVLFHFNRSIESDNSIAEIDKQGCRPGTTEELRALGEKYTELQKYPEFQKEFSIVALGFSWQDHFTGRRVCCLRWDGSGYEFNLSFGDGWGPSWRFLAFRKKN